MQNTKLIETDIYLYNTTQPWAIRGDKEFHCSNTQKNKHDLLLLWFPSSVDLRSLPWQWPEAKVGIPWRSSDWHQVQVYQTEGRGGRESPAHDTEELYCSPTLMSQRCYRCPLRVGNDRELESSSEGDTMGFCLYQGQWAISIGFPRELAN